MLRAHLHELAILLLRLDQKRALGRVVAAGLFNIDMLARLEAGDRHRGMPVVRGSDGDGVHILQLKDVAKILVNGGRGTHFALHIAGKLLHRIAIHIAYIGDPGCVLVCLESGKMSIGAAMKADHSKVEAIIGAEDLAIALGGRSDRQTRGSYCKGVEKFTSSNQFVSPFEQRKCGLSIFG